MGVDEQPASGLGKALIHGEGSTRLGGLRIDNSVSCSELMDVDQSRTSSAMDDSLLLGGSDSVPAQRVDDRAAAMGVRLAESAVKVRAEENGLGKRRRGRPPRAQQKATPTPRKSISSDEEDVCFICFDGGSLVLCDRRGCPKAYHPACIKRDEAFFQSTAKWNCGWHICSSCRKASHYMCYTCTYSLCKGCIKDADYQCVRGSKGLCGTCMRTVMLLEKSLPGSGEHLAQVQVDFDDKSSWEYLFKIYWVYLKRKLSLTLDDLIRAKNPWNGGGTMEKNGESIGNCHDANNGKNCRVDSARGGAIAANSKRKTFKRQQNFPSRVNSMNDRTAIEGNSWATKELLEFVAHARNGDTSALSQFDVQSLVLEYIKANNLRDPQQRSHILCDRMLMNLFGKQRVGHFEMLKLLEYHFLTKESSSAVDRNSKALDVVVGHVEEKGNDSHQSLSDSDRKRKTHKKADNRKQLMNPDEYAAIDVHNINLIYLSRNLIESIMGDAENFRDKVVDSFVRIRISNRDQKPDVYRLVQVVGTSKSSEPYVIGEKTADVMLDVLNLDKKEAVSIEGISNQDFSEDECRRLHDSVKCGLLKRFTVGEIQKKAMALQALKVNDPMESEILRLNHLRDRASEKGHKKEHRECVEKLQLLNSPEERQRRLVEIPEIHVDPTLDPSFKPDDHTKESNKSKQGGFKRACKTGSGRKRGGRDQLTDSRSRMENRSAITSGQNMQICTANHLNNPTSLVIRNGSNPLSNGIEHSNDIDMDKIWHYQDPAGKIQGPFSMSQLQKWSSSGHFPPHLRVWRISEKPGDSILLTDAMKGQYGKNSVKILEVFGLGRCSDDGDNQPNDEWSRNRHSNESGSPTDCSLPADGVNSSEFPHKGFEQRTAEEDRGHSYEKRSDSDGCSGQSSGQNWRPLPANASLDSRSGGIALSNSIEQQNLNFDFPDLPSPTPAKSDVGLTDQAAEIKQSASSRILVQDSVPSWSTGSSLVGGRKQLPVYSPTPAKASAEEWDSSLITSSSLKPAEFISDCTATPASVNDRLTHSLPSHPASNISLWPEIIDPEEFNSLGDESVSDLLAEVEAMESLSELASSTSMMNCRDDLMLGCKTDCFSSVGGLSPTLEMGRGDALSSTGDGQVPSQSTITDKPLPKLHMFDIDLQMKVAGPTTVEVDINKKLDNVSTNQWQGNTGMQISTHLSAALSMETAENTWRIGSEATDASWGSADIEWGGINRGNSNSSREIPPESIQEMGSMNSGTSAAYNTTNWYGQLKYGVDRLSSPRDNGRGRSFWDKQPVFGGGGNRSVQSRAPLRGQGQRVCKFYESGCCKRGASCCYLHP